jgi:hypothetical protein
MSGIKGVSITGYSQGTQLSISTTEATIAVTDAADYSIWSDVECFVKIAGPESSAVTATNGWILFAGSMPPPIWITAGSVIRVITATGTGTFCHHKIGVLR